MNASSMDMLIIRCFQGDRRSVSVYYIYVCLFGFHNTRMFSSPWLLNVLLLQMVRLFLSFQIGKLPLFFFHFMSSHFGFLTLSLALCVWHSLSVRWVRMWGVSAACVLQQLPFPCCTCSCLISQALTDTRPYKDPPRHWQSDPGCPLPHRHTHTHTRAPTLDTRSHRVA